MIKQINVLFFLIIFPFTLWCSHNGMIRDQEFCLTNRTGHTVDVKIYYDKNGRPCNLVFCRTGAPHFKIVTVRNIYGKDITLRSYRDHFDKTINLYYKTVPIDGKMQICE